ncbi:DUF4381 domain-containing protein [Luteimonas yindakuii]|uniref:DUF4381 domain-containing protein n=1 Tax=Luteimonas yindakuii TaxID=2565782 RepID=UPI0011077BE7|nr:DUF4381 domain-containing protein [Luteimonas yindakuii]QCU72424.1 DUF4381 domain-containing protein [Luteimonas yindakuii]
MATGLVLRDIHQPAAPGWWPPAPGWWLLATVVLVLAAAWLWWRRRVRRRRLRLQALFDDTVATAPTPAAQVGAISELLRRAARDRDPRTATLADAEWIGFLRHDDAGAALAPASLDLLRDGGYRREVAAGAVEQLRGEARALFLAWSLRR